MKGTTLALRVVCLSALPVDAQTQAPAGNPLFQTWTTPFGVPPYDQIRSEHFLPGFQRAIEERRQEVVKIAESGAQEHCQSGGAVAQSRTQRFFQTD